MVAKFWGPGQSSVAAELHRDESSPHAHLTAVPRTTDGRVGWKPRLLEWQGERKLKVERLAGRYAALQDEYYEQVGKRYGLVRGVRGSTATHEASDRQIASEEAARIATAKREAAEEAERLAREAAKRAQTESEKLKAEAAAAAEERAREEKRTRQVREQREREEDRTRKQRAERHAADDALRKIVLETAQAERRHEAAIEAGRLGVLRGPGKRGRELIEELDRALEASKRDQSARVEAERERAQARRSEAKARKDLETETKAREHAEWEREVYRERVPVAYAEGEASVWQRLRQYAAATVPAGAVRDRLLGWLGRAQEWVRAGCPEVAVPPAQRPAERERGGRAVGC